MAKYLEVIQRIWLSPSNLDLYYSIRLCIYDIYCLVRQKSMHKIQAAKVRRMTKHKILVLLLWLCALVASIACPAPFADMGIWLSTFGASGFQAVFFCFVVIMRGPHPCHTILPPLLLHTVLIWLDFFSRAVWESVCHYSSYHQPLILPYLECECRGKRRYDTYGCKCTGNLSFFRPFFCKYFGQVAFCVEIYFFLFHHKGFHNQLEFFSSVSRVTQSHPHFTVEYRW